jgi:hypothetical protein
VKCSEEETKRWFKYIDLVFALFSFLGNFEDVTVIHLVSVNFVTGTPSYLFEGHSTESFQTVFAARWLLLFVFLSFVGVNVTLYLSILCTSFDWCPLIDSLEYEQSGVCMTIRINIVACLASCPYCLILLYGLRYCRLVENHVFRYYSLFFC